MKKSAAKSFPPSSALTLHGSQWGSSGYFALLDTMRAPAAEPARDPLGRLHEANRRAVYLLSRCTVVTVGPGA